MIPGVQMRYAFAGFLALVIGGCAMSPENIQSAYVSALAYQDLTCPQLKREAARMQQALAVTSQKQQQARDNDVSGVILIGVPMASFWGEDIAPQIAALKGHIEAIDRAWLEKNCR
jgi:hypothetical protein